MMLPLTHKDKGDDYKPGIRLRARIIEWCRAIFTDAASRNLFCFLTLNLSFAFVELFYGIWTNSLGLISDSFHMFFDCTALMAGLAATVISKWGRNERYSYGYVRSEVLAGFVNGLFLLFVAFFIFSEAVERAFHTPDVEHERLLVVSVLGFLVNIIGIFVFHHGGGDHGHSHGGGGHGHSHGGHGHSHGGHDDHCDDVLVKSHSHGASASRHGHSHGGHGHSHGGGGHGHSHGGHSSENNVPAGSGNQIMKGVFLHILADTMGSVGVIISAILMEQFGWMLADPICSMFISVLIALSVIPLLQESVGILMQRTPSNLDNTLHISYQRVNNIEDVHSIQDPHFWTLCSGSTVGTLRVLIAPTADSQAILRQVHTIFSELGVKQLYVQVEHSY